jgi:hypothetical protein
MKITQGWVVVCHVWKKKNGTSLDMSSLRPLAFLCYGCYWEYPENSFHVCSWTKCTCTWAVCSSRHRSCTCTVCPWKQLLYSSTWLAAFSKPNHACLCWTVFSIHTLTVSEKICEPCIPTFCIRFSRIWLCCRHLFHFFFMFFFLFRSCCIIIIS